MKPLLSLAIALILHLTLTSCDPNDNVPDPIKFEETRTGYFYHLLGTLQPGWDLDADQSIIKTGPDSLQHIRSLEYGGGGFMGRWESKNGTVFVLDSTLNYNDLLETEVVAAFNTGQQQTIVNPRNGEIYVAKHINSYYVIKVVLIDHYNADCACGNTGKLTFEYKKK